MARRFRRRRRSGGLWLPVLGNPTQNNVTDYAMGITGYTPVLIDGSIVVTCDEVTFDYKPNPWAVQSTVADFSPNLHDITGGNEWRLRRIVGKCFATYSTLTPGSNESSIPPGCECAAGYIVLKTDEEGAPLTDLNEVNPLIMESADDPWIWRRKWKLANVATKIHTSWWASGTTASAIMSGEMMATYPYNTAGYGSVADGPHIDQKTNRIIHRQERLFFMMATRFAPPINFTSTWYDYGAVYYSVDHRFFGGLSFQRGNRKNASR